MDKEEYTEEEVLETEVSEGGDIEILPDEELEKLSYEEIKAKSEAVEASLKDLKGNDDVKKLNQIKRYKKAVAKKQGLLNVDVPNTTSLGISDMKALIKADIDEDSEKFKVLESYVKAGIVKSFKEGLSDAGVLGKFAAIDEATKTQAEIERQNDLDEENLFADTFNDFDTKGVVPTDKSELDQLAKRNVEKLLG